jgi:16S rRNA (uracil1498-N3)-methyltransferase
MQLFFNPNCESFNFLDENDSKHCIKVLRKKKSDIIHIVDGVGGLFECSILVDDPKKCQFTIISKISEYCKPTKKIHVAIAPTKNTDRIEWFVEKAVEIGVSEISFIICANSERKHHKNDRIQKIAISAMKQALKAYVPKINEPKTLAEFVKYNTSQNKLVAHLSENSVPIIQNVSDSDICILIGPEGDFSKQELELLKNNQYIQVSMGNSRLRTETAGVVAVTLLNCI